MMSVRKRNMFALVGCVALMGVVAPANAQADRQQESRQQQKETAKIGEPAPTFKLTDTQGKTHNLADLKGKVVVLEWFNPGCPVVVMHHEKNSTMRDLHAKYKDKDVVWLAINSGAQGMQGYGKDTNEEARQEWKIAYPVLLDESGNVGRSYGAKTTPHMYIIDREGKLVYNGAIDSGSGRGPGDTNYVDQALTEVLAGETVSKSESKPYGCSVKYGKNRN